MREAGIRRVDAVARAGLENAATEGSLPTKYWLSPFRPSNDEAVAVCKRPFGRSGLSRFVRSLRGAAIANQLPSSPVKNRGGAVERNESMNFGQESREDQSARCPGGFPRAGVGANRDANWHAQKRVDAHCSQK